MAYLPAGSSLAFTTAEEYPEICTPDMRGYANEIVVRRGVLRKGVAFQQKPLRPDSLARKVTEVVSGR